MGLGGFFKGLLKVGASAIPGVGPLLGAAGAATGSISQAKASNRGEQFGGQMDLQRLLMERDQQAFNNDVLYQREGRTSQSDAARKLIASQRLSSPSAKPMLSPYDTPQRTPTGMEMQGMDALSREVLARLQGGNPLQRPTQAPMQVDPKLLKAGKLEQILGYASPALSFLGRMPDRSSLGGYPGMAGTNGFGG